MPGTLLQKYVQMDWKKKRSNRKILLAVLMQSATDDNKRMYFVDHN